MAVANRSAPVRGRLEVFSLKESDQHVDAAVVRSREEDSVVVAESGRKGVGGRGFGGVRGRDVEFTNC